jgi:HlyD family secretion protein
MNAPLHINADGTLDGQLEIPDFGEMPTVSLRSEKSQQIISAKPGFIERWSLLVFLFIILICFAGTFFIRYPDVLQESATLTAANSPKEIVTRTDGKLVRLFVANDDKVVVGQMLAWMESTASHSEVIKLSALLDKGLTYISHNETEKVAGLFYTELNNLGELQTAYRQFITAWQQFNDYLTTGYYYRKKKSLYEDVAYLKKMHQTIEQQQKLAEQDMQLTKEAFEASDSLFRDKVISSQDLRDQKGKLVNKQMSIPQLQSSLLANEDQEVGKLKDIDELEHTISQQKIIFQQEMQTLKSQTDDWIRKFIIKAPVDGKITFIIPLQENQFIPTGKTMGFVNPSDSRYYAQVNLRQANFGKIDTGQKVQLRFDAYPYQEFGFVEGRLRYISKVPSDSGFLANIELPKGLVTNYKKEIQYRSGLQSQALIITRESSLIQRFYYNIRKNLQAKN